jgi:hypothetical protein
MTINKKQNERYELIGEFVSIFQRGETWYVHYRDEGKPRRLSLKTTKKKQAHLKALAIERDLIDGRSVRPARAPKIVDVIEQYICHLHAVGRSKKTIEKYRHCFRIVLDLAAELRIDRLDQLDLDFIDTFRHQRMRYQSERECCPPRGLNK